jgi:hypothetical protein
VSSPHLALFFWCFSVQQPLLEGFASFREMQNVATKFVNSRLTTTAQAVILLACQADQDPSM